MFGNNHAFNSSHKEEKEKNGNEFRWNIGNIRKKMGDSSGLFESSPIFSSKDTSENKWELRVFQYFSHCPRPCYKLLVTLRLVEGKPVTIKQSISILDCRGRKTQEQEEVRKHSTEIHNGVSVNRIKLISRFTLEEGKDELTPNGTLTLCCRIAAVADSSPGSSTSAESQTAEVFGFGRLLEDPLFSDITLVADGREFHVHRGLLASRSSKFADLFQGTDQRRLEITDMRAGVLQVIIHFIYTGSADNVSFIEELLVAAKKYGLRRLEEICETQLIATLTVDNVVDRLVLAKIHAATELKRLAMTFIVKNAEQVAESTSWSKMLQHPELISEAFRALVTANKKENTTKAFFHFGMTNQK